MANEYWNLRPVAHGAVAVLAGPEGISRICYQVSVDAALAEVVKLAPAAERTDHQLVSLCLNQLSEYFAAERQAFDLELDSSGLSPFAAKVHRELCQVPYGSVVTYGELAVLAGSPGAARAVGRVMAANPFPLIVPCHRVVNADGSLGRYSAAEGTKTKSWLIEFERKSGRNKCLPG